MSFGCCAFLPFNIVSHLIQVDEFCFFFLFCLNCCWIILVVFHFVRLRTKEDTKEWKEAGMCETIREGKSRLE
jgi:hypothetical protein